MLTQLTTVKARLALDLLDPLYDALLTSAITAISARFDRETNRTLARTVDYQQEFAAASLEFPAACYPIESVAKFEIKASESAGWIEQNGVEFLVRNRCLIQLAGPLPNLPGTETGLAPVLRLTYTGGYLLPGSTPVSGATALPADLEQAALEQTVFWFQTRDKVGLLRQWPAGGNYEQFADPDLLPSVRAVLAEYTRFEV